MKNDFKKTKQELIAELENLRIEGKKREEELTAVNKQLRAANQQLVANNQQLLESEARLKEAEIIARMGNFTWEIETGKVTWSDGLHLLLGYDKSEKFDYSKVNADIHHPEDLERITAWLNECIASGKSSFPPNEYRLVCKDGKVINVQTTIKLLHKDDSPYKIVGTVQDITERKLAEEALRKQEHFTSAIINTSPAIVYVFDMERQDVVFISTGIERLLNYSLQEIRAMGAEVVGRLLHPDDLAKVIAFQERIASARDEDVLDIEYRVRHADGSWRTLHSYERPFLRNADGSLKQRVGVALDVSERELAEKQRMESETRLKEAQRLAKIGNWELDLTTNTLHWSDEVFRLFGLKPHQFESTYEAFLDHIHPDDREFVDKAYTNSVKNKEPYNIVHRLLLKNGSIKYVNERCKTVYDDAGNAIRSIGTIQDITERKQAEEALQTAHARFLDIIESMSDAFVSIDRNWCYTYMNKKAGKIFNRDPQKMIGKNIWKEFPEGVGQPFHLNYERAMKEKVFIQMEDYYPPYDKWFENRINPTEEGIAIFFNDITERKKEERAYKEAKSNLVALLDNRKDSIWSLDRDYNYIVFNKPYADVILREQGVRLQKGLNALEIHPKEVREFWKPKFDEVFKGKYVTFEFSHLLEGEERFFEVSMNPILSDGEITGLSALSIDITKRKQAEEKLKAVNQQLEEHQLHLEELVKERTARLEAANKELESFSYSVAHDLRAPLRAIDGFSKILRDDYSAKLDSEGSRILNVICDSTQKMDMLIKDLLELSRLGRSKIRKSRIDMSKMVNSIFYEITHEESRKRIQFEIGELGEIQGDHAMLKQVWINLLSNAIKYSSKKEKSLISVTRKNEKESCVFCIKDNGVGFDTRYNAKLFGVFQRLHSAKEFEGTGVGLAIVKRIVSRHGGRVWADSQLGKGATFYFSLPVKSL